MREILKRRISVILSALLILGMIFSNGLSFECKAGDFPISGSCGYAANFTLDANGTLTISGTGEIRDSAFAFNTAIKQVVIGNGITKIGMNAFHNCSALTGITFPDDSSLTTIGESAFESCISLTIVSFPAGFTTIGYKAFESCKSLNSVTIPGSVTSIGGRAFASCIALSSVTIADGVPSLGNDMFYNCTSLSGVTIPQSVTSIGEGAFKYCTSLASVTIPDGSTLTSIGQNGFLGCGALTAITIPAGVTSIGKEAFKECDSLATINFKGPKPSIGPDAIPETANMVYPSEYADSYLDTSKTAWGTFFGNPSLNWVLYSDGTLEVSGTGSMWMAVGDDAPWLSNYKKQIKKVVIKNGVTEIGCGAFYNCSALTSISIPSSVTKIEDNAFYGCSSLKSIIIPAGVTEICSSTFYNCTSLTSITIPEGVATIQTFAFSGCTSLKSVNLPGTVSLIMNNAFWGCSSLTGITIPASVTTIEDNAFKKCSALNSVTIQGATTTIASNTFDGCSKLETIRFEGDTTDIPAANIPSTVKYIVVPEDKVEAYQGLFTEETLKNKVVDPGTYAAITKPAANTESQTPATETAKKPAITAEEVKKMEENLGNAAAGSMVTLSLGSYHSIPTFLMNDILSCKADVELTYTYQGKNYEIYIPAGKGIDLQIEWYGPLLLYSMYGKYSKYQTIVNEFEEDLGQAVAGETVTLPLGAYHSMPSYLMGDILNSKADVEVTYTYNGKEYTIYIPAGKAIDLHIPWYGPLLLYSMYGK